MSVDYKAVIANALSWSDSAGNAYRSEAAARVLLSAVFCEAMKACEVSRGGGFPLAINGLLGGDDFALSSSPYNVGPDVKFSRSKDRVTVEARLVSPAALLDEPVRRDIAPAMSTNEITTTAAQVVEWAVRVLARHFAQTQTT